MQEHTQDHIQIYRDIPYIIHVGPVGAYCAYIRIPDNHPWNKLVDKISAIDLHDNGPKLQVHDGYNDINPYIDVHGGLTFCCRIFNEDDSKNWPQGFTIGAWIGWVYAHYGDFIPALNVGIGDIHHSKLSVEVDCKHAIDQMLDYTIIAEKNWRNK